jgi:hypothetical protein
MVRERVGLRGESGQSLFRCCDIGTRPSVSGRCRLALN